MDCAGVMLHSCTTSDTPTPATVDSCATTHAFACRVELDGEFLHRPSPWLCGRREQRLPKVRDILHESLSAAMHTPEVFVNDNVGTEDDVQTVAYVADSFSLISSIHGYMKSACAECARSTSAIHNGEYCGPDNRRQPEPSDNRRESAQPLSPLQTCPS